MNAAWIPSSLIVMADDDSDDRALARQALGKVSKAPNFETVGNGQDLLDLLRCTGTFAGSSYRRPSLILLDLNMPLKNGFETLQEIRSDEALKGLPVVIWSTSRSKEDVEKSFNLGCNSFLSKPGTFNEMANLMGELMKYWFETSEIPGSAAD